VPESPALCGFELEVAFLLFRRLCPLLNGQQRSELVPVPESPALCGFELGVGLLFFWRLRGPSSQQDAAALHLLEGVSQ
jgi:hypothetical protein